MAIKELFNGHAKEWLLYKQLTAAIKAQDMERVREVLKKGASVAYRGGNERKEAPLAIALRTGNVEIFKELLESRDGRQALLHGYDSRLLAELPKEKRLELKGMYGKGAIGTEGTIHFEPSFLYAAIEMKQEKIALFLARNPDVPGYSGVTSSTGWWIDSAYKYPEVPQIPKFLDLAKEKGMTTVVDAIEDRIRQTREKKASQAAPSVE